MNTKKEKQDVLNRTQIISFFKNIIKQTSYNNIITINSPWGTGKTFLIEQLISELKNEHICIYFNAWEQDFSDSPFLSFISSIQTDLKQILGKGTSVSKLKDYSKKTGKFLIGLAPIIGKAGLRTVVGDSGIESLNALLDSDTEKETIKDLGDWADKKIKAHIEKENSLLEFKKSLEVVLEEMNKKGKSIPLIIFIDDMDRCRPDYAIKLLETIKHMFNVKGIVFVLATDLDQLVHSVKAIYGVGIDGETYLRKILEYQFQLPKINHLAYATLLDSENPIDEKKFFIYSGKKINSLFSEFSELANLSLRDQNQIYQKLKSIELGANTLIHYELLLFLLIISHKHKNEYLYFRNSDSNFLNLYNKTKQNLQNTNLKSEFPVFLPDYDSYFRDKQNLFKNLSTLGTINAISDPQKEKRRRLIFQLYQFEISLQEYLNYVDLTTNFQ